MKKSDFPILIPVFGLVALWLRWQFLTTAVDDRGLLMAWHPLEIRLWVLTAAVLAAVIWVIRSKQAMPAMPKWAQWVGCLVLALAIAVSSSPATSIGILRTLHLIFRWAAFAAIAELSYSRLMRKAPLFLCYLVIAAFFAFHALANYQTWCRDPQMMHYVFALLSCICLMLFAYQQAARQIGIGSRPVRLFTGMMGTYLCFAAFPQWQWLYLAGGIWMLTSLERNDQ